MKTVALAFIAGTAFLSLIGCGSDEPAVTPEAKKISCEQLAKWWKIHVATEGLLADAAENMPESEWHFHLVSQSIDEKYKIEELEKVCYSTPRYTEPER